MKISKTARILVLISFLTFVFSGADASAQATNQAPNQATNPVPGVAQPPAMAAQPNPQHGGGHMAIARNNPSCQNILSACKNAGFIDGQAKQDNGLWKDCFHPIVSGKGTPTKNGQPFTVPVNASDVQTCHAAIAAARPQR